MNSPPLVGEARTVKIPPGVAPLRVMDPVSQSPIWLMIKELAIGRSGGVADAVPCERRVRHKAVTVRIKLSSFFMLIDDG